MSVELRMKISDLGRDGLEKVLDISQQIEHAGVGQVIPQERHPQVIGSLLYGGGVWDQNLPPIVANRLQSGYVSLQMSDLPREALGDLLAEFEVISVPVDLLIASYVDMDTFGGGLNIISAIAEHSHVPFIGLRNEIYAHISALAHLSLIREKLGSLSDRKITVRWAFGNEFVLPSTVHSIMLLGPLLGCDVEVVCPPEFQPLRRVMREASKISNRSIEVLASDVPPPINTDAVISLNWRSLQEFNDLARLRDLAFPYKDWYLTRSNLPEKCLFLTEPPIRTEVMYSPDILASPLNLTPNWLAREVNVTLSLLAMSLQDVTTYAFY